MLTDRDITVKVGAEGRDPGSVKVSELVEGKHDLVGMVSQADVARNLPEDKVGDLVEAISKAPANS